MLRSLCQMAEEILTCSEDRAVICHHDIYQAKESFSGRPTDQLYHILHTEWSLLPLVFEPICRVFVKPVLDVCN